MAIKIYVGSDQEKENVRAALELLSDNFTHDSDYSQDINDLAHHIVNGTSVVVGAAELDTALMSEIGKAYKEQYTQAVASGNKEAENRMYGAMFAVKKIMEMVSEPAI